MKANRMWFFSDLLEKNKRVFKVPVYQRNYDWTSVQCEKLFEDIMLASKFDKQHFTGTVVYIEDVNGGSGLNEVLIIDGQQRITTMYILLKALYDASKGVSVRIENELTDVMFNRNCDEKYKVKLKPVKSDNEQLNLLVNDKIEKMDRNSNVYKNYIIFKNLIDETISKDNELGDILNGIKKLELVEIILDKHQGDEAQKIFESINSTGLDLSLADLIRNYLLMDDDNQDELYNEYWLEIEKNVGYANLGDFVINYLNSQVSKNVKSKNAYVLFKEYCDVNSLSHEQVLNNLKRTSKYYGSFVGVNIFYSQSVMAYLKAFNTIKQTTIIPLLFRIFDDFEENIITEEELCKVLEYLLTYFVRINACDINKNLAKFMKSMYGRVITDKYDRYYERFVVFLNTNKSNNRMPSDKEFRDALLYKPLYTKNICKYVLSVIENSSKEHIDIDNLTIEHILPQKENAAVWKKEIGNDYDKVYELYLHTLGNLTFTGYNSELGTKSFNEKKKIIKENSKANILNKDVIDSEKWNEESILLRANKLADILIEKFSYENVETPKESNELCFGILDGIDFTDTKPNGFAFMGEYIKANNWAELLSKFVELVYDLNSEALVTLANENYKLDKAKRIYITNDQRILRRPKEIGKKGIFYETNLSAENIISFIKSLIIYIKLDPEDFNVYLRDLEFNINDRKTWTGKGTKVAQLFYYFVEDLIKNDEIDKEEIEKLKTKEYSKDVFKNTSYPAVSEDRNAYMGSSKTFRYRAVPLNFKGEDIYISTQFFDSGRDSIIEWYERHK